ncbi:MAG: maleylpyruvate isomerase family mycothiol-dependent enzyme [Actinobacteria bacterium]|nr:maleylpyruvate isomerase family mycothiol-dependent enzyme [Actinomycetota bacterium]
MDRAEFLERLEEDSLLLGEAAARDMTAAVPFCAGWTVRDAVEHVAEVYEHKIAAVKRRGERPEPWPPTWPEDRDPLAWFSDARARLLDVLARTDPAAPSWTWWPPDQTAGFWVRRMAQETAVHRVDVQGATGTATPVDAQLAVDGIDEVLLLMFHGDWTVDPQPGLTGTVNVVTSGSIWRVAMTRDEVTVVAGGGAADATITAEPSPLLLWLWGRAGDEAVDVSGSHEAAARLRQRLALATQ